MSILRPLLKKPEVWYLNRRSVSGGFALGIFLAFIPLPFHTFIAIGCAYFFSVNVPVTALTVWLNNPITMVPIFYLSYRIGAFICCTLPPAEGFEFSLSGLMENFRHILLPCTVGSLLCGAVSAAIGFSTIHCLWQRSTLAAWRARGKRPTRSARSAPTTEKKLS